MISLGRFSPKQTLADVNPRDEDSVTKLTHKTFGKTWQTNSIPLPLSGNTTAARSGGGMRGG